MYHALTYILFFFFNDPATTEIYTLSLHDALPISSPAVSPNSPASSSPAEPASTKRASRNRSEEHTSELQSRRELVCRLLLEKKKIQHDGNREHPPNGSRDSTAQRNHTAHARTILL